MTRLTFLILLAASVCGCSIGSPKRTPRFITDDEVQLISIIREVADEENFSLKDAIYTVRPDGHGWIVQVDRAPGYTGVGDPLVVVDATFIVKFNDKGDVTEVLSFAKDIKPTTKPNDTPAK